MKKSIVLLLSVLALSSCHQNLQERAQKEATEFTKRNCPMRVNDMVSYDSVVFDKSTTTFHYYYTLSGKADDAAALAGKADEYRRQMIHSIREDVSKKAYKEAGYSFTTTYFSQKDKGRKLLETTVTQKDYQ